MTNDEWPVFPNSSFVTQLSAACPMARPIVLGITGASGAIYALRLVEVLRSVGHEIHLSISPSGRDVMKPELNLGIDLDDFDATTLRPSHEFTKSTGAVGSKDQPGEIHYFRHDDFMAPMASGSFLTAGMVICPCSGTTLSAVASGAANNLIQRAAEVHLKERRKLILVPRETPLSLAHIDNMRRVTEASAVVLPASPGWYHGVRSTADLVDFVVARICDQLGVEHSLTKRWGVVNHKGHKEHEE
jgi:4-hydroxy-3-polyprenylbenzoate decarboxylase